MKSIITIISLVLSISSFSAIKSVRLDSNSIIDIESSVARVCINDQSSFRQYMVGPKLYDHFFGLHFTRLTMDDGTIIRYKIRSRAKRCKTAKSQVSIEGKKIVDLMKTIQEESITFENNVCVKTIAYIDIDDETGIGSNIQQVKLWATCQ
jgi:hypothetical protein